MVVMEGVCSGGSGSSAGASAGDPVGSAAIASHRAWYDINGPSQNSSSGSGEADIDAYFKAGSNASSYFSHMQGAYPGMSSYHGMICCHWFWYRCFYPTFCYG